MNIKLLQSSVRSIRRGDPAWVIKDGFVTSPRAGFQINKQCPKEYRAIIAECINRGWLEPVANVTEHELMLITLGSE